MGLVVGVQGQGTAACPRGKGRNSFPMSHLRFEFPTTTRSTCSVPALGKLVSHQQKTFVQSHVDSKGHQQARKMWKLCEEKHAERAEETPTQDVPQCVSTLAQPTLLHVARTNELRYAAQDDLALMLLGTEIPQEKVDHPRWRAYQEKYNSHHGSIPRLSSTFPKNNALRLYLLHTFRDIIQTNPLDLFLDEWSDERGAAMLGVIGHVRTQRHAFDV